MKDRTTLSRRKVLQGGVHWVVVSSGAISLIGCTEKKLVCTDTSGLNQAATKLRQQLEYQDLSPYGTEQDCAGCDFFRAANREGQCGACTMVQGPINPAGYCNNWAPKES
ncbi:MAG: high-potential iron-sulfur protein [Myxococcota bacterium]